MLKYHTMELRRKEEDNMDAVQKSDSFVTNMK